MELRDTSLVLAILFMITGSASHGQNGERTAEPLIIGTVHQLESKHLNEERALNVYVPTYYASDTSTTMPVIYVLDGGVNEDLLHTAGIVQFLTMIGSMPPSLVVGIGNIDRKRDFTFPTNNEQDKLDNPTSGGSQKFMAFLQDEVVPFIDSTYRTNGPNTLIGQSLGGLLLTELVLKRSMAFDTHIIVSPSLWWDDGSLLTNASELLSQREDQERRVIIMVGNEGEEMIGYTGELAHVLQQSRHSKWKVDLVHMAEEDHLTILHNALYKAFMMLHQE